MLLRSAAPTEVLTSAAERRWVRSARAEQADRAASDQAFPLTRSVLAFAVRCHTDQPSSDGVPYIEHLQQVARLLRTAGCSDALVAAGVLHHVVANSQVSAGELAERFGADVAALVTGASNDRSLHTYRHKPGLSEHVHGAAVHAAVLLAADAIGSQAATGLRHDPGWL
jgi:(p)ppGpp synthase/HD superfamily hydrolase